MTRSDPTRALSGARTGHICDRCNKRVQTGELVQGYATHYDRDGWVLRRLWCEACRDTTIGDGTDGADETIIKVVFWNHRLVSVTEHDRN